MDLEVRAITEDERLRFGRAINTGFGGLATDEELEHWDGPRLAVNRTLAAFDDGEIVGTAGAYSFQLTVPGGVQVPTAGVTVVTVRPTHRRRGLLVRMMDEQLDDVAARAEPLAALTASESSIYERFGYGWATFNATFELPTRGTTFASPSTASGRVRLVDHADGPLLAQGVYDTVARTRVGEVARGADWWARTYREQRQPASPPEDGKRFFTVVHEDDERTADAFARYSIREAWPDGQPAFVLSVHELQASDPEAEAALWEYLVNVDLVATVEANDRPVDDPLRWRLADPRRLRTVTSRDHLWLRIVDVATALSARVYAVDDALVFELRDAFRPANSGTWRVEGGPDGAQCARTDRDADLVLSARDLGGLYLGGVDVTALARAGRVEERTSGAITRADRFFATRPSPWCTTHF